MTNLKDKQENTLEKRTADRLESIESLMDFSGEIIDKKKDKYTIQKAINNQCQAIYEQNEIIIDYLKEIYKELRN